MSVLEMERPQIADPVARALKRIAPVWPLSDWVAVNPYLGLSQHDFCQADGLLRRVAGTGLFMPRAFYREQMARGRITRSDVVAALHQWGSPWDVLAFEQVLDEDVPRAVDPALLITDLVGRLEGQDWSHFVLERISHYCAAYFDEGQALWSLPFKDASLYGGWIRYARLDQSPRLMGLHGLATILRTWPETPEEAIGRALDMLNVPAEALEDYLYALLLSVGGWAAWTRYLEWQGTIEGGRATRELMAIRLSWEAFFFTIKASSEWDARWREALAAVSNSEDDRAFRIDAVLQTAFEVGYQRQLFECMMNATKPTAVPIECGRLQAAFCIDVRSEVFRRALETVAPEAQTLGFAGFFGIPMAYLPFGAVEPNRHLPVFFEPSYRVGERMDNVTPSEAAQYQRRRHLRARVAKAWKTFKMSAASTFGFVEAAGLWSLPRLICDSMGWTRSAPHPLGISERFGERLRPALEVDERSNGEELTGIPVDERPPLAQSILRNMGLSVRLARLVLLVGHGSTSTNNPQAAGLDCGASGGHSGEASARVAAALLNDPETRAALFDRGVDIPGDTYFVAGLHDTTTDDVRLLDVDRMPPSHQEDVAQLLRWLDAAGAIARRERSPSLGIQGLPESKIPIAMRRRGRDWAQVRPEWGLAGNAAFIAAPRTLTAHCSLDGRAFLHEYDWHRDPDFATLELIMTAPLMVAHWINMQYYGSVVDPGRWGSGNKVLHNVVGGSIGVLEGNGGDLRVGLALQSLHDGKMWRHEPMRLTVVIAAPEHAIDAIIETHAAVRDLVEHHWLHLFQMDDQGTLRRRESGGGWRVLTHRG